MHSYKAMMADYGELFWLSGYTFQKYTIDDEPAGIIFIPTYTKSEEKKKTFQSRLTLPLMQSYQTVMQMMTMAKPNIYMNTLETTANTMKLRLKTRIFCQS